MSLSSQLVRVTTLLEWSSGMGMAGKPLERRRQKWANNIKMGLKETGYEDVDWTDLLQDRIQWWLFHFHKMLAISWVAEQLLAFEKGSAPWVTRICPRDKVLQRINVHTARKGKFHAPSDSTADTLWTYWVGPKVRFNVDSNRKILLPVVKRESSCLLFSVLLFQTFSGPKASGGQLKFGYPLV